jgi:hypothetical protein
VTAEVLFWQPPFSNSADRVLGVRKVEQVCKDSPRNSRSSPFIHERARMPEQLLRQLKCALNQWFVGAERDQFVRGIPGKSDKRFVWVS